MKKVSKVSSKINMTKIILLIITIVGFAIIMYFVVKYFLTTCPEGSHYDKSFNSCVKDCPEGQVNDIDGSCVCPDGNQTYKNGKCINICNDPLELCGTTCYNPSDGGKCMSDDTYCPATLLCGEYCVISGYYCSNGNINFTDDNTFILTEGDKSANITVPKGNYVLNIKDTSGKFKSFTSVLQNLLESTSPKCTYTVSTINNKLNFEVSKCPQLMVPIFNFTNTLNPEKFGFKNSTYSFINNKIESEFSIEDYTLLKGDCPEEKMCGNICCEDTCIENNGIKTCCPKENVCGEGDNKTCCPPNADGTTNCCDGKCCNSAYDEKCVKDETTGVSKCLKKCPKKGPTEEDVYCDTNTPGTFCEEVTNPNTNSQVSLCKHKDCVFDSENYTPENINGIPVCSTPDNKIYSKFIDNKTLTRKLITKYAVDTSKCKPDDCVSKLIELGAGDMTSEPEKGICSTTFNCRLLLDNNSDQCPFTEDKQNQCCMIGGSFTGQVCSNEYPIALLDPKNPNECICIKGWVCSDENKSNDINGNTINTGKVCKPLKYGEKTDKLVYSTKDLCEKSGCLCAAGWRWDGEGEESCNDFICKDNIGRSRPDMWEFSSKTCTHKQPSISIADVNQTKYCHMSSPGYCNGCNETTAKYDDSNTYIDYYCKGSGSNYTGENYRCDSYIGDSTVPGYLPKCCPASFTCTGENLDITGITTKDVVGNNNFGSVERIDKLTGDKIKYSSSTNSRLPINTNGDYICEVLGGSHWYNACPFYVNSDYNKNNKIPDT
jgi:hypothetical protein